MLPERLLRHVRLLKIGDVALRLVGMPKEHHRQFALAAQYQDCVISTRQLGRVCTGLMTQGYDTKGFRIKSKSCDFGPMAGFLCADERFHKKGAAYNATQRADVGHALRGDAWDTTARWRATTQPICLTPQRLRDLRDWSDPEIPNAAIAPVAPAEAVTDLLFGEMSTPVRLRYALHREQRDGDTVWALYESAKDWKTKKPPLFRAGFDVVRTEMGLTPILGLANPYPAYPRGHYLNCCTGDYDLFGVWPRREKYDPLDEDRRIGGMLGGTGPFAQLRRNQQITQWEDKRLGNISNRVHTVAQVINSLVNATGGPRGAVRNVVHHSDEAGRPFIDGIDDHVLAFVPYEDSVLTVAASSPGGIPNQQEWTALFGLCNAAGFQIIANGHWMGQLSRWGVHDVVTTGDERGWRTPRTSPARST